RPIGALSALLSESSGGGRGAGLPPPAAGGQEAQLAAFGGRQRRADFPEASLPGVQLGRGPGLVEGLPQGVETGVVLAAKLPDEIERAPVNGRRAQPADRRL